MIYCIELNCVSSSSDLLKSWKRNLNQYQLNDKVKHSSIILMEDLFIKTM